MRTLWPVPVVKSVLLVEKVMVDSVPVVAFVVGLQRGPLQRTNPVLPVVDPELVPDDPVESLADVASVEGAVVGAVVGAVEASIVEASVVIGWQRRSPLQRLPPETPVVPVVDSVLPVVESNVDPVEPIVVGKVVGDGLVENGSVETSPPAVVLVGSEEIK